MYLPLTFSLINKLFRKFLRTSILTIALSLLIPSNYAKIVAAQFNDYLPQAASAIVPIQLNYSLRTDYTTVAKEFFLYSSATVLKYMHRLGESVSEYKSDLNMQCHKI